MMKKFFGVNALLLFLGICSALPMRAQEPDSNYVAGPYYTRLCDVICTGNAREDIINIALSQLGYREGDGRDTEYARFIGRNGKAWCTEFASWCVRMTGLPQYILHSSPFANAWRFTTGTSSRIYRWSDLVYCGGDYAPRIGDILLWAWDLDERADGQPVSHTALFHFMEDKGDSLIVHSLDGNSRRRVAKCIHHLRKADGTLMGREGRLYYVVSPDYDNPALKRHWVNFDAQGGILRQKGKMVTEDGLYGPLPIPRREGYAFAGWYSQADGGACVTLYTLVPGGGEQTLYARWKPAL